MPTQQKLLLAPDFDAVRRAEDLAYALKTWTVPRIEQALENAGCPPSVEIKYLCQSSYDNQGMYVELSYMSSDHRRHIAEWANGHPNMRCLRRANIQIDRSFARKFGLDWYDAIDAMRRVHHNPTSLNCLRE